MKKILFVFTLIALKIVFGQEDFTPEIGPPSPDAYKFSTYGNLPINKSTGAFQYSLPLHSIELNDIKIGLSLNYRSSGVLIDELSGVAGIDWSLDTGGIVSRIVRDEADENSSAKWYPDQINPSTDFAVLRGIADNDLGVDTEPDWFTFSVNGLSGRFYLDENLNVIIDSEDEVKIEFNYVEDITHSLPFPLSEIIITDLNGYQYVFGGSKEYIESSMVSNSCQQIPYKLKYLSSWFLKYIRSPKNNEIHYTYEKNIFTYSSSFSSTINFSEDCKCEGDTNPFPTYSHSISQCISYLSLKSKVVKNIRFGNDSISFSYSETRKDSGGKLLESIHVFEKGKRIKSVALNFDEVEVTSNDTHPFHLLEKDNSLKYRYFLNQISIYGKSFEPKKNYLFEYIHKEKLPIRLSYSKDFYGYHNESNNYRPFDIQSISDIPDNIRSIVQSSIGFSYFRANLKVNPETVHFGLLTKITYPTGGHTDIEYEPNSNLVLKDHETFSTASIQPLVKQCGDPAGVFKELTFVSNGEPLVFNASAFLNTENTGCEDTTSSDSLHDIYSISVFENDNLIYHANRDYGVPLSNDSQYDCSYNEYSPICTNEGDTYRIRIALMSKRFNPATGYLSITYNKTIDSVEELEFYAGARVLQTKDFNKTNELASNIHYYYNRLEMQPSASSSLNDFYSPIYFKKQYLKKQGECIPNCNCYQYDINSIEYFKCKMAAFTLNENPKLTFSFSTSTLNHLFNLRSSPVYYSTVTELYNSDGENGAKEFFFKTHQDSKSNPILLPEIIDTPMSNFSNGYINKVDSIYTYKFIDDRYSLSQIQKNQYQQKAFHSIKGFTIRKNYNLTQMLVSDNYVEHISLNQYSNIINTLKLNKTTTIDLFPTGNITHKSIYQNEDTPPYRITKVQTSTSNGDTLTKKLYYPQDLLAAGVQSQEMQGLIEQNRIGVPVKTEQFINQTQTAESITHYARNSQTENLLLADAQYAAKGDVNLSDFPEEHKKITYNRYDSHGNILQYTPKNGIPVSIIWGYNNQYPIAKIEGATYSEIESEVANLQTLSNADNDETSEQNLFNGLNSFRGNHADLMITTYTYDPLIGVTSITPPNGQTAYYEYDGFGRLKSVKDESGNKIQDIQYHYRPTP